MDWFLARLSWFLLDFLGFLLDFSWYSRSTPVPPAQVFVGLEH